jgi:hypothetical protein
METMVWVDYGRQGIATVGSLSDLSIAATSEVDAAMTI